MAIMRWDPFRELEEMRRNMDRWFEESFGRLPRLAGWEGMGLTFPIDMYETDDSLVVKASLPGVDPDEVDISVTGDSLTIKGEHKAHEEIKRENYHRQELRYGAFARTVALPMRVQSDRAEATFENGILSINLPKAEEVKAKTIKIQPKRVEAGTRA